ncbi:leishmanolysin-related zinc metalloendopeptidase [Deinococcus cellulosilyticus]|uniref:leishmanolysin-related zinc metalloendopeptidase n=1 Tax=Deinococcus cellulosilyticus TaxID=401558 RepID=UPI00164992AC|nr:leishmanolysin-related zinc metalloendopeptidase [Deinococcus cellulosilyticus]
MKKHLLALVALMVVACNSTPVVPSASPKETPRLPSHLLEIHFQDTNSDHPTTSAVKVGGGIDKQWLSTLSSGITFQSLSSNSFTVRRTGTRYLTAVYKVTNNTGRTLHNLSFIGVNLDDADGNATNNSTAPTPGSTIFRSVRFFDGSDASARAASLVAGPLYTYDFQNDAAKMAAEGTRFTSTLDVTGFEVAPPAGLTSEVTSRAWVLDGDLPDGASRTLTFSVSYPMASTAAQDPFGFSVMVAYAEDLGLPEPFNIQLTFPQSTLLTPSQKQVFETAARRWEKVILEGSNDFYDFDLGDGRVLNVDDLEITADAVNIDGVGGVLGRAGPEFVRPFSEIPITGIMQFDAADLAQMESEGSLQNVILHEMGHVLGIGTLERWDNLLVHNGGSNCQVATSVKFNGANAMQKYLTLGGSGQVPVEDQFGAGTKCGHWKESVFDHELMTGFVESGPMPLSALTTGALQDLGYVVNHSAADTFQMPSIVKQGLPVTGRELNEILLQPRVLPGH